MVQKFYEYCYYCYCKRGGLCCTRGHGSVPCSGIENGATIFVGIRSCAAARHPPTNGYRIELEMCSKIRDLHPTTTTTTHMIVLNQVYTYEYILIVHNTILLLLYCLYVICPRKPAPRWGVALIYSISISVYVVDMYRNKNQGGLIAVTSVCRHPRAPWLGEMFCTRYHIVALS